MSAELLTASAAQLAQKLAAGDVSAREVVDAHLARIAAVDGVDVDGPLWRRNADETAMHAYVHVLAEHARAHADDIDARRAAGAPLGPLAGVPLASKDILTMRGAPTTCGSRMLADWVAPYDATVTRLVRDADLVVVGKTNMDEFAMGSSTENSAFGPTRNPWHLDRVPGGSSGGSAAAVAGFTAPLAIGTDTGGSIRQPAALTGIVGAKPTYGTVSRHGLVAFASSLDQAGPFARTVEDAALLQQVIQQHDPKDATSIPQQAPDVLARLRDGVDGLRIGVVQELRGEGYEAGVAMVYDQALARLEALGATLVDVSLPHARYGLPAYYLIAPSECSSNLARFDGVRYGLRVDAPTAEEMNAATRAAGFGARGPAPHHDWHARVVVWLLRRLLPTGEQGSHAHCSERLFSGFRTSWMFLSVRRHRAWRSSLAPRPERSVGDVPQRRRDGAGITRRHPCNIGPGRIGEQRRRHGFASWASSSWRHCCGDDVMYRVAWAFEQELAFDARTGRPRARWRSHDVARRVGTRCRSRSACRADDEHQDVVRVFD
jgi:aspartyl-tRNA(Asn)/glutamyl-tRNA(Gln) amidotransferase subunit A